MFCNLYPHLCLETLFPAVKLTQNCYLHYNINIFYLKSANLIINWLLFDATCHRTERRPSPFDQIWRQGDKNLNFQNFQLIGENLEMKSRLFKNPSFPYLFLIGKNLEIRAAPDFSVRENLCPNLSFTVESKMGNYVKEDGHISNLT